MRNVNEALLVGYVGGDPNVSQLPDGTARAHFSMATSERFKGRDGEMKEQTEWHSVVAFGQNAEAVEKFVRKGTPVMVRGKINQREYVDQNGETQRGVQITCGGYKSMINVLERVTGQSEMVDEGDAAEAGNGTNGGEAAGAPEPDAAQGI